MNMFEWTIWKEIWSKDGILLSNKNEGKFNFQNKNQLINKFCARIVPIENNILNNNSTIIL